MTAVNVTLIGNLARDPELRFTPSGKAVVTITVVTSKSVKVDDKWEDRDTTFWECSAWDRLAENIAETLLKGDAVIVYGSVAEERWENNDGTKGHRTKVSAWEVGAGLKKYPAKISRAERKAALSAGAEVDPWAAPAESFEPPF